MVYEDRTWQTAAEGASVTMLPPISLQGRPLSLRLWALTRDWTVGRQHLIAPAVHAVNAALLVLLAVRLGVSVEGALLAGACVLLLPVQTQAVSYLSARADVFAATCVLIALVCATPGSSWTMGLLVPVALVLAMLCKETAVIGVVLVPLVRRQWAVALLLLGIVVGAGGWYSTTALALRPTLAWGLLQTVALGRLLGQMLLPTALTVDFDYHGLSALGLVACLLAVGALLGVTLWTRRRAPVVAIGLAIPLALLALRVALVTPGSVLNDAQAYLGIAGLALAAGAGSDIWEARCRP